MPQYKNKFKHVYVEYKIVGQEGEIGTLRVKPSSILWKPVGKHKFFAVPLERFGAWITSVTAKARLVTQ